MRDEVLFQAVETHRQRPRVSPGTKPHIDAKHAALFGRLVQQPDQALAHAHEIFVVGKRARADGFAFLGIDQDEVDVGGDVELAAAELAHAHHDQPLRAALAERPAELRFELALEQRLHRIDANVGERGHGGADFAEVGAARKIARHGAQEHAAAQPAQARAQSAFLAGGAGEVLPHFLPGPGLPGKCRDFARERRIGRDRAPGEPRKGERVGTGRSGSFCRHFNRSREICG